MNLILICCCYSKIYELPSATAYMLCEHAASVSELFIMCIVHISCS